MNRGYRLASGTVTDNDVFAASSVLIVAGKGGVGKTTVGASMAFAAACGGYHVLLIELEGYSNLGQSLGIDELGYEPTEVDPSILGNQAGNGRLEVMQLRPDEALADYLDRTGLGPLIRRFSRSEAVEVVSAAAPGIKDPHDDFFTFFVGGTLVHLHNPVLKYKNCQIAIIFLSLQDLI